ncbi:hypothetical protein, partial [Corynebacterium diphtheriae]|uniref:hypothetical protein n=1 Tax=Corynebacterium diphtheriae TaxID=1717 RepID=UPI001C62B2D1
YACTRPLLRPHRHPRERHAAAAFYRSRAPAPRAQRRPSLWAAGATSAASPALDGMIQGAPRTRRASYIRRHEAFGQMRPHLVQRNE